jgi:hypothetical protein
MISLLKSYRLPSVADSTARTIYFFLLLAATVIFYLLNGPNGIFPSGGFGTWSSVSILLLFQIFYNNRLLWLILLTGTGITSLSSLSLFIIRVFLGAVEPQPLVIFICSTLFFLVLLILKPKTNQQGS